jgi:hypothetical protein
MTKPFVLMCLALFSAWAQSAEIRCAEADSVAEIDIKGVIEVGDAARFERCSKTLFSRPRAYVYVAISSKGGLITEAMRIGREIRKRQLTVFVPSDGECLSSCIFVFAGGTQRAPAGTMGIHRPYFLKPPEQSYDATLKVILKEARAYFYEMNIPEHLADAMFSVTPDQVHILGKEELAAYRLDQDDMATSEERDMARAAKLGLSRQEYLQRVDQAKRYRDQCLQRHDAPGSVSAKIDCAFEAHSKAGLR